MLFTAFLQTLQILSVILVQVIFYMINRFKRNRYELKQLTFLFFHKLLYISINLTDIYFHKLTIPFDFYTEQF